MTDGALGVGMGRLTHDYLRWGTPMADHLPRSDASGYGEGACRRNRGQLQLGWLCGHWNRLYLGKRHLDCAHSRLREEPECLGIILGWY